jgi:DnaK suppressor protein
MTIDLSCSRPSVISHPVSFDAPSIATAVRGFGPVRARMRHGRTPTKGDRMDDDRARELLAEERRRIEQALATSTVVTTDDESTTDDADNATDTYQNEFDEGRSDDLNDQLAAVERAERRLADGRFGLSIESGDPIPDERLEAIPTAERTVDEEQRFDRGA